MRSMMILLFQKRFSRTWCLACLILPSALQGKTNTQTGLKVLGVIEDSRPQKGLALIKSESTSKTFTVREGELIDNDLIVDQVSRKYVTFRSRYKLLYIKVGDFIDDDSSFGNQPIVSEVSINEGIERQGNLIKVSASLREYVAGPSLGKILMQAAAVPHYNGEELKGFGLYEIEKDSVYEKAGFINGDVILSINGQHLSNVGQAIKVLHSLKTENEVEVQLLRDGVEQTVFFQIK